MTDTTINTDPTPNVDLNSPSVQAAIAAAVQTAEATKDAVIQSISQNKAEILDEKKKLQAQFADIDLEDYQKLKQDETTRVEALELEKGNYQTLKTSLENEKVEFINKHTQQIEEMQQATKDLKEALEADKDKAVAAKDLEVLGFVKESKLLAEMSSAGVQRSKQLLQLIGNDFEASSVDGSFELKVKDSQTTVGDYLNGLKDSDDYSWAFGASGATGGDATGNQDNQELGEVVKAKADMTQAEKSQYVSKHGHVKFAQLT